MEYLITATKKSSGKLQNLLVHRYKTDQNAVKYFEKPIEMNAEDIVNAIEMGDIFYAVISSGSYIVDQKEYFFFNLKGLLVEEVGIKNYLYLKLSQFDLNIDNLNHLPGYEKKDSKFYLNYTQS